jgi:hypothetical protein
VIILDIRLIDPGDGEVHAAITRVFDAVNSYGPASRITSAKIALKRMADRTTAEPEGAVFLASATQVGFHNVAGQLVVAWWTAAFGRKHVRVTGRIIDHAHSTLLNETKLNTRPPLWHVYPERVYRRRVGPANDIVTVCGCGACGSERMLSWAGPSCGPCLDYTQEHGAPPLTRPALFPTAAPCVAVAVSANGRRVAGATSDHVYVWDLDMGTEPQWEDGPTQQSELTPRLALSADGSYLAVVGGISPGLWVADLRGEHANGARVIPNAGAVAFHPGGRDLVYTFDSELVMAELPALTDRETLFYPATPAGPVVVSPNDERVAVRNGEYIDIRDIDKPDPPVRIRLPASVRRSTASAPGIQTPAHVAFSADGEQIAIGVGAALSVHFSRTGDSRFWDGKLPDSVTGVAFDPAGKWLYTVRHDGSLLAYRTDRFEPEKTVTLRWGLGPLSGLAVTGDGETLYTAGDEGVKAWPIRRLLEGV